MGLELLSEFEAAQLVKLSPTLLRWCTSYAPKGDGIKLPVASEDNGVLYYEKAALLNFNNHLGAPWVKPENGQRPNIPVGIEREIKGEALFRCPICNTNAGEIAHIKPVSKTLNNHPHNLIFLCPTHHTVYDYGYKFNNISEAEVKHLKKGLQIFQSIRWSFQSTIVESYLVYFARLGKLHDFEKEILECVPESEFEGLLQEIISKIKKNAKVVKPKGSDDSILEPIIQTVKVSKKSTVKENAYAYLDIKSQCENEIIKKGKKKHCPLCKGKGFTDYYDLCPVCSGECYIGSSVNVDLSAYEVKQCPLCDGNGSTADFETCPPCGGTGRLTQEQIELIDFRDFDLIECPLCDGKGTTDDFDSCPPCGGDGRLTREQISLIDFSQFEYVDCPLCRGKGHNRDFDICPACHEEGRLTREQISYINFSDFEFEDCPLCNGKGHTDDFDICPACNEEGRLTKDQIARIDFDAYDFVNCRLCKGKGYTNSFDVCPPCGGDGRLTREQAANIDFSDFEFKKCPVCKGKGHTSAYDTCPVCRGDGQVTRGQLQIVDLDDYL